MVFCTNCGTHDVCPMQLTGEQVAICDVCGSNSVYACGECDECKGEFLDENFDDEYCVDDDDDFPQ